MSRRLQPAIWIFCAVLLLAQSILPASAMAQISVRCVGTPVAAPACAEAILPVTDATLAGTHLAPMSCCRHMRSDCPMMSDGRVKSATNPATLAPLPCRVSVTPLNTEQPLVLTSVRQWMLDAAPALAPPSVTFVTPLLVVAILRPTRAFAPLPDRFTHSHGLRAPPAS